VSSVRLGGEGLRAGGVPLAGPERRASAVGGSVRVAHLVHPGPLSIRTDGPVRVNGRPFPGDLTLLPRPDDRLDVVNAVPLEHYVERAVTGEVFASWPAAALAAQAVVARTYALHEQQRRAGELFDVEAGVRSQRYVSGPVPGAVRRAAAATRGEYLAWAGAPILAVFHAAAGGRTASAAEVWGDAVPYLVPVASPDADAPDYFWSFEIERADLLAAAREAGLTQQQDGEVRVLERTASGRVGRVQVADAFLSGRELRQLLGGRGLRSTLFELRIDGDRVRFLGSGAGHGVGLSQWGARELARRGRRHAEILAHYFPGTALRRLDADRAAREGREAPL
jgi:stage II sporulation protein D